MQLNNLYTVSKKNNYSTLVLYGGTFVKKFLYTFLLLYDKPQ